jgi:nuclear pore complex protein Nup53
MGRSPERRQLNFSQIRSSSRPGTAAAVTPSMGTLHNTPIASMAPDTMVPMSTQRTPPSPAQMDPFYTQGENLTSDDRYDEHCVTVFGFPKEASAFILEQFSQYGTVLRHVIADGNYMHICYQSKLQARTVSYHFPTARTFVLSLLYFVLPCMYILCVYTYSP